MSEPSYMSDDAFWNRIKKSVESDSITFPSGLNREQRREFILKTADKIRREEAEKERIEYENMMEASRQRRQRFEEEQREKNASEDFMRKVRYQEERNKDMLRYIHNWNITL